MKKKDEVKPIWMEHALEQGKSEIRCFTLSEAQTLLSQLAEHLRAYQVTQKWEDPSVELRLVVESMTPQFKGRVEIVRK